jgi:membrane protease YdiL (CAAX protease family)
LTIDYYSAYLEQSSFDLEKEGGPVNLTFVMWDRLLLLGLASAIALWWWQYPRFVRAQAAGARNARPRYYAVEIVPLWVLAVGVISLWIAARRPWGDLLLGRSALWRLALGWALAAAYVGLTLAQRRMVLARPALLARIMKTLGEVQPLLPRTPGERKGFATLSITAGICEELLFRGFVLWYATRWAGPVGGFLISSASFGIMHVYLGARNLPRATIAGVFFYVVVIAAGSLLPATLCHSLADLVSGDLGYRALTAGDSSASAGGEKPAPSPASI